MKTTLVVAIFLLTEIVWTTVSITVQGNEKGLSPRDVCPTSYAPFCTCSDFTSGRELDCTVSNPEDFDGIRDLLSADSYQDYFFVRFRMSRKALDIPADVLGGKRAVYLDLVYPRSSTPPGGIAVDAFQSTLTFTNHVELHYGNLTDFSFDFLAPFSALRTLSIYSSSLKTIKDMPSLPTLTAIQIGDVTDFESWYYPSLTPNLEYIGISYNSDLDDRKMDSILSSMTDTYQKLSVLNIDANALTRVPPLAFSFPALTSLGLDNNPIVNLTTGSVNNTYDNLNSLGLSQTKLTTVEPGAFVGNFSSAVIYLYNNRMTTFPSSSFQYLLESMVGHSGYVDFQNNPIVNDCGLAWLIRDNRQLLPYVRYGTTADGIRFEDLNPDGYSNCF